jgi:hypothetical protein
VLDDVAHELDFRRVSVEKVGYGPRVVKSEGGHSEKRHRQFASTRSLIAKGERDPRSS